MDIRSCHADKNPIKSRQKPIPPFIPPHFAYWGIDSGPLTSSLRLFKTPLRVPLSKRLNRGFDGSQMNRNSLHFASMPIELSFHPLSHSALKRFERWVALDIEAGYRGVYDFNTLVREQINDPSALTGAFAQREFVAGALVQWSSPRARLDLLVVDRAKRRQGIAYTFLTHLLSRARLLYCQELELIVRCDNVAALGLYERFNAEHIELLSGYYQGQYDGLRIFIPVNH
jgi:ribosomal protein S18 acetylase RimI-like enzyme